MERYRGRLKEEPFLPITDFHTDFTNLMRALEGKSITSSGDADFRSGSRKLASGKKPQPTSSGRKMRDWGEKVTEETIQALDLSEASDQPSSPINGTAQVGNVKPFTINLASGQDFTIIQDLSNRDVTFSSGEEINQENSRILGMFNRLTGRQALSAEDLKEPLGIMRDHLIHKNVAGEAADFICSRVQEELIGKKTGAFGSIAAMIKAATEDAVSKLLRLEHQSIGKNKARGKGSDKGSPADLLTKIKSIASGESRRPFVMAFVGVNGVGKSTNLAKVCFWLLQNQLRVLLVAGDTFRSGAVEQLRVHVRNLGSGPGMAERVELFERGYGKDAANVAKDAIRMAREKLFDVVMIDTAGRMQDNAPLMAALAKLVYMNRPDKLIFVGEALVGNEAVDQLKKFNQALQDYAPPDEQGSSRRIDGILLTKFDTIDDKVGAALSMTFIAKAPILFVGVGQTYTDLRKLDVASVVTALLK